MREKRKYVEKEATRKEERGKAAKEAKKKRESQASNRIYINKKRFLYLTSGAWVLVERGQ